VSDDPASGTTEAKAGDRRLGLLLAMAMFEVALLTGLAGLLSSFRMARLDRVTAPASPTETQDPK
jgi:hypothetical protein